MHSISVVHGGTPSNYLNDFLIVKLLGMGMEMEGGLEVGREMGTPFLGDDSSSGDCGAVGLDVLNVNV